MGADLIVEVTLLPQGERDRSIIFTFDTPTQRRGILQPTDPGYPAADQILSAPQRSELPPMQITPDFDLIPLPPTTTMSRVRAEECVRAYELRVTAQRQRR